MSTRAPCPAAPSRVRERAADRDRPHRRHRSERVRGAARGGRGRRARPAGRRRGALARRCRGRARGRRPGARRGPAVLARAAPRGRGRARDRPPRDDRIREAGRDLRVRQRGGHATGRAHGVRGRGDAPRALQRARRRALRPRPALHEPVLPVEARGRDRGLPHGRARGRVPSVVHPGAGRRPGDVAAARHGRGRRRDAGRRTVPDAAGGGRGRGGRRAERGHGAARPRGAIRASRGRPRGSRAGQLPGVRRALRRGRPRGRATCGLRHAHGLGGGGRPAGGRGRLPRDAVRRARLPALRRGRGPGAARRPRRPPAASARGSDGRGRGRHPASAVVFDRHASGHHRVHRLRPLPARAPEVRAGARPHLPRGRRHRGRAQPGHGRRLQRAQGEDARGARALRPPPLERRARVPVGREHLRAALARAARGHRVPHGRARLGRQRQVGGALGAAAFAALLLGAPAVSPARVTPLFNGKDLSGWTADVPARDTDTAAPASFVVRDGMLVSLGTPPGHLLTDASYRDYRLEVEYRFPGKGGNCGVLVHASKPRALYKMFPQSIEVQMQSGDAGDFWCIQEDIEVPDMETRRPRKDQQKWGGAEGDARRILNLTDGSEKPLGEWNTMVVEARGRGLKVWVNGDLVNDGRNATADQGRIALQAEGTEVEFRKVEIGPLGR